MTPPASGMSLSLMRNPEVPTLFPSSNIQPKTLPPVKNKEDRKTFRQTEIPVPPRLSLSPLRWTDGRTCRQTGKHEKKKHWFVP